VGITWVSSGSSDLHIVTLSVGHQWHHGSLSVRQSQQGIQAVQIRFTDSNRNLHIPKLLLHQLPKLGNRIIFLSQHDINDDQNFDFMEHGGKEAHKSQIVHLSHKAKLLVFIKLDRDILFGTLSSGNPKV
jgi:hypothetical protein